ncbi:hypothetical protein H3146_03220 [Streptomyces sp. OF3]|uniref:Uncharacterized protein n=1 Tax=Streptomyces alkaliterrae TaxID=2213162 RepID=A0A7W3ZLE8_9ACTN|nr:hypothetical protein [Streptomyces alkaliterrae]MBB1252385.1 hypothetical protein [Streptomyces alkaliterrae]
MVWLQQRRAAVYAGVAMALCLALGMAYGWRQGTDHKEPHLTYDVALPAVVPDDGREPWPTQGELQDDKELLRDAMRAFLFYRGKAAGFEAKSKANRLATKDRVELLFAGETRELGDKNAVGDGAVPYRDDVKAPPRTVLLRAHLKNRRSGHQVVFRYEDRGTSRSYYDVQRLPGFGPADAIPLLLNPTRRETREAGHRDDLRLLVPKRLSKLRVAGFGGEEEWSQHQKDSYDWRPVKTRDGVTEPLRTYKSTDLRLEGAQQDHGTGVCRNSGLLLRATLDNTGFGAPRDVYYVLRSTDFTPIEIEYTDDAGGPAERRPIFDAAQLRTLARSLMCDPGPVSEDEALAKITFERLWNGRLPGGDGQRQELVRIRTSETQGPVRGLAMVGVDDNRHFAYFPVPRSPQPMFDQTACVARDNAVVVAGGHRVTRVEVTDLRSGEKITRRGATLVARRPGDAKRQGPLAVTVTRQPLRGSKTDGDAPTVSPVYCYLAPDTPTFDED